jgi:hypothetical protein
MTDNVIPLKPPTGDPEIVETLRVLLSEAQAGRLTGIAVVYLTDEGDCLTAYHMSEPLHLAGATALLHKDALDLLTE